VEKVSGPGEHVKVLIPVTKMRGEKFSAPERSQEAATEQKNWQGVRTVEKCMDVRSQKSQKGNPLGSDEGPDRQGGGAFEGSGTYSGHCQRIGAVLAFANT